MVIQKRGETANVSECVGVGDEGTKSRSGWLRKRVGMDNKDRLRGEATSAGCFTSAGG